MKMSVFSKTLRLNRKVYSYASRITQGGSDTVLGPFYLLRCAEPQLPASCSCAGSFQATCLRDAYGDGQGGNW